ncbi:MAG: Activator of Hsp90 ATPase 1 family protein [Acidimicrobiaceae bacterium]|nr:Activator of Hsp90 ATPase 1 family protein [Acidimicrobiaceae bacterium]
MEYGSIEREIHIDAAPDVVFDVISSPAHIRERWGGVESDVEPTTGATGELVWGGRATGEAQVVPITVVDAVPPRCFSFRWVHSSGEVATAANSLLVNFELVPSGAGTVLRLTETGFREMGWEVAVLEEAYKEHSVGWDAFVPRIGEYVIQLTSTR